MRSGGLWGHLEEHPESSSAYVDSPCADQPNHQAVAPTGPRDEPFPPHLASLDERSRTLHKPARRTAGLLVAAVLVLTLAACGTSATTTTTTLPSLGASTAAIKHAYAVLFDLANSAVSPKLAVVQDGAVLQSAMKTALKSALAKSAAGATVQSIDIEHGSACKDEFLPSPCAKVVYDILSPTKAVVLHGATGLALYQHGHWLVGKTTICTLLELADSGSVPPGC